MDRLTNIGGAMDTRLLRLTWAAIDEAPAQPRYQLSIAEQIKSILGRLEARAALSPQERSQIENYLCDRQHLIQDLYQAQVI